MKSAKFLYVLSLSILVFSWNLCYPETIILKSGKKVVGKIVEKTNEYIKIDLSDVAIKYYLDEITSIDGQPAAISPAFSSDNKEQEKPLSIRLGNKQNFINEKWGYSFEYPSDWEIIPKQEQKKGFAMGFRPKSGEAAVKIQIQRGNYSDTFVRGKSTLNDFAEALVVSPELKRQSIEPINLGGQPGCLIKYVGKIPYTLANFDKMGADLVGTMSVCDDYYYFSPVFSSEGLDKRFFLIELSYIKFDQLSENNNINLTKEIINKEWAAQEKKNKEVEMKYKEALEIVNSFRYFSKTKPTQDDKTASALPSVAANVKANEAAFSISLGKLKEAQEYIEKGRNYLKDKQYKEAIIEFQKALEINPNEAFAYIGIGVAHSSLEQPQQAIIYLQKALQIAPNYIEAYNALGYAYTNLGKYEEAIICFQKALKLKPEDAELYSGLAYAYTYLSRHKEAIDCFKKAIRINPNYIEAYIGLGHIYTVLGQYQDAIEKYQEALKIKPDNTDLQNGLGAVYNALGKYTQAIDCFQKVLKIDSNNTWAYSNLGNTYGDLGQYEQAITYYKKSIAINSNFIESYIGLGYACVVLGRHKEARENFLKAKELFQNRGDTRGIKLIEEYLSKLP